MIVLATQGTLFDDWTVNLPYLPFCTDSLDAGLVHRPRDLAIKKRYLQLNPNVKKWALIFDLDLEDSPVRARDVDLPEPTYLVINRQNNHAHYVYGLETPLCTSDYGRLAPLQYAASIETAYRDRLSADPCFGGLISKNPWNPHAWRIVDRSETSFSLDYLADFVDIPKQPRIYKSLSEYAGLGRNCCMFSHGAEWAYSAVRRYFDGIFEDWAEAVLDRLMFVNYQFVTQLPETEVQATARSISKWVWKHFSPEGLQEWHVKKGAAGARVRWKTSERKEQQLMIIEALKNGLTVKAAAERFSVSESTVWRIKRGLQSVACQ